jgi:hypothetical protein
MASDNVVIHEQLIGKDIEESYDCLIRVLSLNFTGRTGENNENS